MRRILDAELLITSCLFETQWSRTCQKWLIFSSPEKIHSLRPLITLKRLSPHYEGARTTPLEKERTPFSRQFKIDNSGNFFYSSEIKIDGEDGRWSKSWSDFSEERTFTTFDVKVTTISLMIHCCTDPSTHLRSKVVVEHSIAVVTIFYNAIFYWNCSFHRYIRSCW